MTDLTRDEYDTARARLKETARAEAERGRQHEVIRQEHVKAMVREYQQIFDGKDSLEIKTLKAHRIEAEWDSKLQEKFAAHRAMYETEARQPTNDLASRLHAAFERSREAAREPGHGFEHSPLSGSGR